MTRFNRILPAMGILVPLCTAQIAAAFDPGLGRFGSGEVSAVHSCFYECKQLRKPVTDVDPNVLSAAVLEDTLLMLVNESPTEDLDAIVGILDGQEHSLLWFKTRLSSLDLDEVNVCRTLELAGVVPPQAGVIEIVSLDQNGAPEGGVYAWVKDLTLKKGDLWIRPQPPIVPLARTVSGATVIAAQPAVVMAKYNARALGVGKTECRVTPPEVAPPPATLARIQQGRPVIAAYEENTFETPPQLGTCSVTNAACSTTVGFTVPCPQNGETCQ